MKGIKRIVRKEIKNKLYGYDDNFLYISLYKFGNASMFIYDKM